MHSYTRVIEGKFCKCHVHVYAIQYGSDTRYNRFAFRTHVRLVLHAYNNALKTRRERFVTRHHRLSSW